MVAAAGNDDDDDDDDDDCNEFVGCSVPAATHTVALATSTSQLSHLAYTRPHQSRQQSVSRFQPCCRPTSKLTQAYI